MTAPANLDAFARAAGVLCAHGDQDVKSIGQAMSAWMGGDGPKRLEAALGLKRGPGQRSFKTIAEHERRNALICEMAQHFWAIEKPSGQADELAKAMLRYHSTGWKHSRAAPACPHHPDTLRAALWGLFKVHPHTLSASRISTMLPAS